MTQKVPASRGVWGSIARHADGRGELARALVQELESGLSVLKTLPPAVTFFGGARVRPEDPYYAEGERMGELLADTGLPPRTGAGPGIMSAVPEGFRKRLKERGATAGDEPSIDSASKVTGRAQALTQGFNIRLPFEQSVNPAIDVSLELVHFPTRKLMLYEDSLGVIIFPGGFGTFDELFEVWRLKCAGRLGDPLVLYGRAFWEPFIDVLKQMMLQRGHATVADEGVFDLVTLCDDPEDAIRYLVTHQGRRGFEESPEELGRRIARELVEGLSYLEQLPDAVTILGGSRLHESDPAIKACSEIARLLAREGLPTRAAGPGVLSVALAQGGHQGARYLPQQAFGMRREDARNLYGADRVHLVNDRFTHKVLLSEGSRAIVAVPGGLGTMDELFSVLCQLQTRKIESRRVILYGERFWTPFLNVLRKQMLEGPRELISPSDMELMTVTDDPVEVARLCLAPPPTLAPRA